MCPSNHNSLPKLVGRLVWLGLLVTLLLPAGCSSNGEKPSFAVSGKVTLDGQPVPGGAVLLINDTGSAASAALGPDGAYSLKCPSGTYRVAISPPPPPDPLLKQAAPAAPVVANIPPAYQEVSTSNLTVEVKDGSVTLDLPLDSKFGGT